MEEQQQYNGDENLITAGYASEINGEDVHFGPGLAVAIKAQKDVNLDRAGALAVEAGGNVNFTYSGGLLSNVGGSAEITNGGALMINIGGSAEITNGGAWTMNSGKNIEIHNGGALAMMGKQVTAENSFVGVVIANQTQMGEGTRVLLDTPRAIAFGAAMGAAFALLSLLLRKPRR